MIETKIESFCKTNIRYIQFRSKIYIEYDFLVHFYNAFLHSTFKYNVQIFFQHIVPLLVESTLKCSVPPVVHQGWSIRKPWCQGFLNFFS